MYFGHVDTLELAFDLGIIKADSVHNDLRVEAGVLVNADNRVAAVLIDVRRRDGWSLRLRWGFGYDNDLRGVCRPRCVRWRLEIGWHRRLLWLWLVGRLLRIGLPMMSVMSATSTSLAACCKDDDSHDGEDEK